MAKISNGLLGGITGVLGNVEGYIRNGVPLVRAKKRKSKTPPSIKQLIYRKRMSVVNKFINSMTAYVRMGFEAAAKGLPQSANNLAKSYQLQNAIQGEYPDIQMHYEAARLTQGNMQLPKNLQAATENDGIRFSWDYDLIGDWENRYAQVMVLVHVEETGESYYILSGARLTELTEFIKMPENLKGKRLHAYCSFLSDDRKNISNSQYLGNFVL